MSDCEIKYIWRCAKCSNHFANISQSEGFIKQEKKCPKCKSINFLTLTQKEIYINCKFFDPRTNGYTEELEDNYSYPV